MSRSVTAPLPAERRAGRIGRAAVVISLALHVAGFVVVVGVPRLLASSPRSGPIYIVDLVTALPGGPAGPAGAPTSTPPTASKPAPPAKAAPPPKRTPEKAIVLPERGASKKPADTPKKPAPKQETPDSEPSSATTEDAEPAAETPPRPNAAPPAAAATGKAPAAAPGGVGVSVGGNATGAEGGGDDYTFYLSLLDRSIRAAWNRPVSTGHDMRSATVSLQLSRTGRVIKLDLVKKSGFESLDRSVLRAVRDAEPFHPFPASLTLDTLTVQIVFDLTPEGASPDTPGD